MMNLDQILDEIEKVSKEHLEDDYKKYIINNLYSLYKERKEMMGVTENSNTFIIDETPLITDVDYNKVKELLNNYKKNKYFKLPSLLPLPPLLRPVPTPNSRTLPSTVR